MTIKPSSTEEHLGDTPDFRKATYRLARDS